MYHGDSVVQRLSEIYQKQPLKLIVIFRDPVHRAYSHYWHMIRLGWEKHSFQKAIEIEGKRRKGEFAKNAKNGRARFAYIESGLYATRLQPFLDRFEKEQFLFLLFEDIKEKYEVTISQVLDFLNLPVISLPYEHRNEARVADKTLARLWLRQSRGPKDLIRKLTPDNLRSKTGKMLGLHKTQPFKYPVMEKELENSLREKFKSEILELSSLINRDLSHWLP